jgi:hypothetical protein
VNNCDEETDFTEHVNKAVKYVSLRKFEILCITCPATTESFWANP